MRRRTDEESVASSSSEADIAYWIQQLADIPDGIELPCDLPRPAMRVESHERVLAKLPLAVATRLRRAPTNRSPLAWPFAATAVFFGKIANAKRLVIGMTQYDGVVPVRVELDPQEGFSTLLARLDARVREDGNHALTDLAPIVAKLGIVSDPARHPLFEVGFGDSESAVTGDLHVRFDEDSSAVELSYNPNLFTLSSAKRLLHALVNLLSDLAEKSERSPVGKISLLSKSEATQLLEEVCSPTFNWPKHLLLHELFEAKVDQTPDAIALASGSRTLTYRDVEAQANIVARALVDLGVGPDSIVALVHDRTPEMIVSILGALKAGGAYLPIEPDSPLDRIEYVLKDSSAHAILTTSAHAKNLPQGLPILPVDDLLHEQKDHPAPRLSRASEPHHLAYVIYTSGSTGLPKGVLIEHRNVVHLVLAEREDFGIRASEALVLLSSYTFDASIDQIWLALTSGAKLVLVDKTTILDAALLANVITTEKVTHLDTIPSLLAGFSPAEIPTVKRVVVGGESCSVATARAWSQAVSFYNEYGPTETTVGSLRHLVRSLPENEARVPIGSPIGMTRAYVLDWGGCLVPPGIRGELFIGGAGVTRGYLHRDDLTRERFLPDPFASPGDRMYRTGDLVAWRSSGVVDFFGRVDSQVKVRGFRIELGEIEAALLKHPDVIDAAVTVVGESDETRRLVCHFQARAPLSAKDVSTFLAQSLPVYMVPSGFMQLAELPKTVAGKVDRRKLPRIVVDAEGVEPPANRIEVEVRTIWSALLSLPENQISVVRGFFELGGHSLLVTQMASRIQKSLGVALRVATILSAPTIRAIAEAIIAEGPGQVAPLKHANLGLALPATMAQRVMYIIQQGNPHNTSNNLPLIYEIEGDLPDETIARGLNALLQRHEALRTGFFFQEGQILQKIAQNPILNLEHYDLDQAGSVDEAMAAFIRPFILEEPPLIRAAVFTSGGRSRFLALDMHHMITDGMSIETMLEDFISIVDGTTLPEVKLHYFDHAVWLESEAWRARVAAAKPYWMSMWAEEMPAADLPYDHPRPISGHHGFASDVTVELHPATRDKIARFARKHEATPFAFFAAVYSLFLSSETGSADVAFAFPSSGRPHPDFERVVGMFVNLLVFRARVDVEQTFSEFLAQTMAQVRESLRNEDYPFDNLIEDLQVQAQPGRRPLIDTMLSYEGFTPGKYPVGNAVLRERRVNKREAKDALAVIIREASDGYTIWFEYSSALFDASTAERFARGFTSIIETVLANEDVLVANLHTVTDADEQRILHEFNATERALPEVNGVHELFEMHARNQPNAPAVTMRDTTWSYAEVNRRANAVADAIRAHGAGHRDSIVGILVEPSLEMLTSILGVLKSGAAFMPIDVSYPLARKSHMLKDSGTKILLTKKNRADDLKSELAGVVIDLDDPALYEGEHTQRENSVLRGDLAYVIYTSGSTGQPKGVMVEHGNILNFSAWLREFLRLEPADVCSKYASFGFDSSIGEIIPAFISGSQLVIVPEEIRLSPDELDAYFAEQRVTVADLPTQFGEQFLKNASKNSLRAVRVGGEKLRTVPESTCALLNEYGPTECTVVATSFRVDKSYDNVPIGQPIWNTQILILDRLGRIAPVGVAGELCIAGSGVARGYLNHRALTSEKFVAHPLARGGRMYRTGDLARWRSDGNIEFLGRIDTQVKVRGFRIELGEIEQALMALPGIKDATAIARENPVLRGDLAIVAFITGTDADDETRIQSDLARTLPPYMVPTRIVRLEQIPLTSNGKVDKRKLPAVELLTTTSIVEPRTETERILRPLYAEVLGISENVIGVETNFVALGGHSLKAAMLLSAIYRKLGIQIRLATFLQASSIANVADELELHLTPESRARPFMKVARDVELPLTSAQSRILAVQQLATWSTAYNIPIAWELLPDVDLDRLAFALTQLIDRHDALRASFPSTNGVVVERFQQDVHLKVGRVHVDDANLDVTLERMVEPFDLAQAPLMRATIVTTETRKLLALDLHHIIADGMSFPILLNDLEALYEDRAALRSGPGYADYVAWEQSDEAKAKRAAEKTWWLEKFADPPNQLDLPYDYDRPAQPSFEGNEVSVAVPIETSGALLNLAKAQSVTPLNPFLAAWALVLARLGNNPDVVIGVPAFGRHAAGTEDIVGMFVNTVPLRMKLSADETFRDFATRVGRDSAEAFDRQAYHLSDLVVDLGVPRDPSRNPLFDTVLEWHERDDFERSVLGLEELAPPTTPAKFDLELSIDNGREGQRLSLVFSTNLFSRATAEKFLLYLRRVLEQVAVNPDLRMRDVRILESWERDMLLDDFNASNEKPRPAATLTDLFDAHVRDTPTAIASEDAEGAYTYEDVDRRASLLAAALVEKGVGVDDVVALAIGRSREILVAVIGILKTGAGYLPLEPDAPEERALGTIDDSGAKLLVTDGVTFGVEPDKVVRWDSLDWDRQNTFKSRAKTSSLAYVIYTSGSTGKPKGVAVEHHNAVNYAASSADVFGLTREDRVLLFSSFTFDASVEQIGIAIASGARVVVPSRDLLLDLEAFEHFLIEKKITFMHAVPLFLSSFTPTRALDLKWVVSGADVCPIPVAERWSRHAKFFNEYGPTETTVAALRHAVTPDDLRGSRLSIGRPCAGAKIYILDWTGNLAPLGVAGEMFVGGPGVSRGYRNNKTLTGDRFLPNPYARGERFYRTGDIARWRRDGTVDFLGRADNQVKIRGFRIELGEIESALLRHPEVAEAAVIVATDQDQKRLCAYVVTRHETSSTEIRGFVARLIPSYMVPDAVVIMAALPVTSSGKLDRKRLPVAVFEEGGVEDAPATEAEWKLSSIWSEVLKLPLSRIAARRSFFELGGHSLLIMQVISRVQEVFGVRLMPADIFEKPTIRELAALIGTRERSAIVRIPKLPETGTYPLSSVQRRLFAIHQSNPNSVSYNIPSIFEVEGHVTRERLEEVVRALIQRHPSLRTSFVIEHGEPVARIAPEAPYSLTEIKSDETIEELAERLVQPFDLAHGPLVRIVLVVRPDRSEVVFVDFHHIIMDGGSSTILWGEVRDYLAGVVLPPLRIHYGDFAAWQATPEHQASLADQRQFWLDRFATLPEPLALPYDFRRPAARTNEGDLVSTSLSKHELDALKALSRGQDATLFVTLISAYFVFLSRIGGVNDLVVGVPTSGRVHPDLQDLIGMFVNTVPWRLTVPTEGTFLDFLAKAKELSIEFLSREEYQLESILSDLGVRAEPGHNPLFDVMFAYESSDIDDFEAGHVRLRACDFGHRTAKMDLTLTATESGSGLDFTFEYATELFSHDTVQRLADCFATLLRSILREPSRTLHSIEILTPEARAEILETFNASSHELPPVSGVHELFEQWVQKTPDAEAVVCRDVHWTYAEVDRRAEIVAAWLLDQGIEKEDRVALLLDPCADQAPAILGIFKIGAVFVPIDASYPVGRQSFMITDSSARALITRGDAPADLEFSGPRLDLEKLPAGKPRRATVKVDRENAAYIIYTSGSTGKPKGVVSKHVNLLNFALWYAHDFGVEAGGSVAKYFGFSFDGSMAEMYPACISGARLVVVPGELRLAPKELSRYLAEHHVSVASFPTPFGEMFLQYADTPELRKIMLGGEKLRTYRPGPWTVVNGYGPTETTCLSTSYPVYGQLENIPVGKPVWNTQIYIVDKEDRLCPIGVAGELCISGLGVARGYLNRPELTQERFVPNPFQPGTRMYRTGDIARWLSDGNIEHLGRVDTQVKVRGYRIELGEIDAALLDLPNITDAAVVAHKDDAGTLTLVAYAVSPAPIDIPKIQTALAKTLPEYMVPDHFLQLDVLPLTTNGKVDRRALPMIELTGGDSIVFAADEIETRLVDIWARVLALEPQKISVIARFVDLGGHSLKAIALMTEIYRELGIELSVADVFAHPTIRSMALELSRRAPTRVVQNRSIVRIPKLPETGRYPLSSVQRRLFAIHQANPASVSYNIPSVFEVEGKIARDQLRDVMRTMFARHASFRTSFTTEQGEPVAIVAEGVPCKVIDVESDESIDELTARLVQPFDISVAPLARVYLIKRSSGAEVLLVDIHHIVFDGTSSTILWREVRELMTGATLPDLPIHYGDFAAWQSTPEHRTSIANHRQFWLDQLTPQPAPLALPYDYRRPANRTHAGDMVTTLLSRAELDALAALSRSQDTTLFTTLISAFFVFLSRIGGTNDLVVGVPTSGRAHPDLENLIGMFVNTVPWRLTVPEHGSFLDFLAIAKTMSLEFLSRESYQLESIIEDLGIRGEADHNPLFDVMFAYQLNEADAIDAGRVRLHGREFGHRTAKMDLMLTASEADDGLELTFEYASELFERSTIERLAAHFATLVRSILHAPASDLISLEILSPSDRSLILQKFNDNARELPRIDGIHELFEEWVERTPNAEAVVCRDVHWTYAEVNRRAEIIAAWLQDRGVRSGDRVVLILDPCADQLPAILGVLKAGAAFVPIDASYPASRQSYMIVDSGAAAILTRGNLADEIHFDGPRLDLDALPNTPLADVKRTRVRTLLSDAAYVIYTSGSTGKPKGVVVEHTSLLNLALWSVDDNTVKSGESISRYFGFSFDPTMSEIFPACITGARLVVVPQELRLDPKGMSAYLAERRVVVAAFPTQLGEQYLLLTENPGFRRVTLCGEKLRTYREGPWKLVNGYGPTETTCYSSSYVVDRQYENIPIGKPLWNTQILILDKHDRLCPIGIAGELCIAGKGLARGYLNKPELTSERFVQHPFEPNARMYRTGDVARWLPDGNIEYLGRADNQVKVRGFRVELGEIEAALLAIPGIEDASVIDAREKSGATALVAYVVSDAPIDAARIQAALAKTLPEFIVPGYFVQLEALPLTPNGKVDRRALPAVEVGDGTPVEPPTSELERTLVAIWSRVLGVEQEKISVTTHFVDLGGHSLKAISLVSELYRELGVELKIGDVFRHPTIRKLAIALAEQSPTAPLAPIERVKPADSYAASSVQERMFFLQQVDPSGVSYNLASLFAVRAGVKKEDVARALETLVKRHAAFRCSFELVGSTPRLRVAPEVTIAFPTVKTTESEREEVVANLTKPFDLAVAPLARAAWLVTEGNPALGETERANYFFFDMHHSVTDGTSTQILLEELSALVDGQTLPDLPCDVVDCAVWERSDAAKEILAKQREHWRAVFADGVPALELITDFPRPAVASPEGETISEELSETTLRALKSLGQKNGLSLYNLCLAAFNVLLARLTRQDDIVVGTPMSGRWHPDMQKVCGMFVNTLVLRNRPTANLPFLDFAREVTRRSLEALDNQAFPFADLVELVGAERRGDRNPLFDVMLVVNEIEDQRPGGDIFSPVVVDVPLAKFDLTLAVDETPDRLVLSMEYRTSLFRRSTVECFLRSLRALLEDVVARPTAALAELSILAPEDRQRVEIDFNETDVAFPRERAAQEMFEEAAFKNPAARALVDGEDSYTYGEVEVSANRLAHRLIALGVGRESIVAVLSEPSSALVIAELAVLKAGAAFLPLDHRYPRERLELTLRDSGARVLLAAPGLDHDLEWPGSRLTLSDALFHEGPTTRPALDRKETDLAYVIYTSGSTGRPKGVAIEHRSLVDYVHRSIDRYGLTPSDRLTKYAGVAFDASIMEIFPALCSGAELHFVPDFARLSPPELAAWMGRSKITWSFLPTQLGEEFMRERGATALRWLVVGGDRLRKISEVPFGIVNEYGPTEFTVSATTFVVDAQSDNIPIGKPNPNTKVFVLDARGELCPPAVAGEICLVGAGMARGYVGAPELTDKKFVTHPLAGNARMYKTGDLGRWRHDGNLEFLGRIDSQVKIRGFRIELGEIEQALLEAPGVTSCVVVDVADESGDRSLVGYFVASSDDVDPIAVRDVLARRLPDYMLPVALVRIAEIPFTTNGKVDRKRLPAPELKRVERAPAPVENVAQALVIGAFERVLGLTGLQVDDDFFELGGNSLKAIAVVAALANDFRINANDLFRLRTARNIARDVPLERGDLKARLDAVAASFRDREFEVEPDEIVDALAAYRAKYKPYESLPLNHRETYRNILLTGATGFLGCFLLRDLLKRTDAKIYVTVRAKTRKEAWDRITSRAAFYFGAGSMEYVRRRIIVVPSNLEEPHLGLDDGAFDQLARTIDCIVHAAALTKHYGEYSAFVASNVDATNNLIALARQARCPFNLISTTSVGGGEIEGKDDALFTELDCDIGQRAENHYIRTKLDAEKAAIAFRREGRVANIFRVGFLTGDSRTLRFQQNVDDSGFVQKLRSFVALGAMPESALIHSFCPVNAVSDAVLRLMFSSALQNETHHIERFTTEEDAQRIASENPEVRTMEDAAFYEWLSENLDRPEITKAATSMLLHEGLLEEQGHTTIVTVRERTDLLLSRLGFVWSEVSPAQVWSLLEPEKIPDPPRDSIAPRPSGGMRSAPSSTNLA
jgi:tyrocidine synthetase-3